MATQNVKKPKVTVGKGSGKSNRTITNNTNKAVSRPFGAGKLRITESKSNAASAPKALPAAGQTHSPRNLKIQKEAARRAALNQQTPTNVKTSFPAKRPALPGAKATKAVSRLKGAGTLGGAVAGGLLLGELLKITRKTLDSRRQHERNKNLSKYLPELTAEQRKNAVSLGQASPEDVGNKTSNTVRTGGVVDDYTDAQGNTYDGNTGRLKTPTSARRSPAGSAPIHVSPSAFGSAARLSEGSGSAYVGSSAATPSRPSTPAQAVASSSETYRDGGKGLYQGSESYRQAVGGSGNPLLNKFRQDMGLDPTTGARQGAPTPQAMSPEAPSQQYQGNDEPGRLGQAQDPMRALAEMLFKNKLKISVN